MSKVTILQADKMKLKWIKSFLLSISQKSALKGFEISQFKKKKVKDEAVTYLDTFSASVDFSSICNKQSEI